MTEAAVFEIVELEDGQFVLRAADSDESSEPLASIRFSSQTLELLRHHRFDVAREMLDHLISRSVLTEDDEEADTPEPAAIH
ncbi:hypothetical protein SAMN05421848_0342 [Kushneria avicenniae]|uniref:Uncharacterized protein n=1 Tax=Kushneria avicenniae TaxID=402385 RepID=A0A1I1G018_9GAMM|nr:hypothetical protein [Kushneria avicenniae]SFC04646.1 hypothetical protein SAMN05421848_0342 [Kushneria avicenniae]